MLEGTLEIKALKLRLFQSAGKPERLVRLADPARETG